MSQTIENRRGWPPPWMIALAGLGFLWFAYGLHSLVTWMQAPDESPTFRLVVPFVLAGLHVVAGYGLVAGGSWGRVLAVLVALAGAVPVIAVSFILVLWAATDPHGTPFSLTSEGAYGLPTWFFLALIATVIAGYGLVLVRALRGR